MNYLNQFNDNSAKNSSYYKSQNINKKNQYYSSKNDLGKNDSYKPQNNETPLAKKTKDVSKLVTAFATIISAAVIGLSGIGDVLGTEVKTQVVFYDLWASATEVFCAVGLEEYDENEEYYVVLHNDFTNRVEKMEESAFEGYFENLKTDMTYTISVKLGNKTIASRTITTGERTSDWTGGH